MLITIKELHPGRNTALFTEGKSPAIIVLPSLGWPIIKWSAFGMKKAVT